MNNVEISAQEAVYIVLQLAMRKSSSQIVFINTNPPEERVHLLKSLQDINDMEDDSEEVYASALLERYTLLIGLHGMTHVVSHSLNHLVNLMFMISHLRQI